MRSTTASSSTRRSAFTASNILDRICEQPPSAPTDCDPTPPTSSRCLLPTQSLLVQERLVALKAESLALVVGRLKRDRPACHVGSPVVNPGDAGQAVQGTFAFRD